MSSVLDWQHQLSGHEEFDVFKTFFQSIREWLFSDNLRDDREAEVSDSGSFSFCPFCFSQKGMGLLGNAISLFSLFLLLFERIEEECVNLLLGYLRLLRAQGILFGLLLSFASAYLAFMELYHIVSLHGELFWVQHEVRYVSQVPLGCKWFTFFDEDVVPLDVRLVIIMFDLLLSNLSDVCNYPLLFHVWIRMATLWGWQLRGRFLIICSRLFRFRESWGFFWGRSFLFFLWFPDRFSRRNRWCLRSSCQSLMFESGRNVSCLMNSHTRHFGFDRRVSVVVLASVFVFSQGSWLPRLLSSEFGWFRRLKELFVKLIGEVLSINLFLRRLLLWWCSEFWAFGSLLDVRLLLSRVASVPSSLAENIGYWWLLARLFHTLSEHRLWRVSELRLQWVNYS